MREQARRKWQRKESERATDRGAIRRKRGVTGSESKGSDRERGERGQRKTGA